MSYGDVSRSMESLRADLAALREAAKSPPVERYEAAAPAIAGRAGPGAALATLAERVSDAVEVVGESADHLASASDPDERQARAFQSLAALNVADAEVAALEAMVSPGVAAASPTSAIGKVWSWITGHLKPLIQKISAHLWQIISQLLTPKGWEIKGGISTGPFGLARAELTISFGK